MRGGMKELVIPFMLVLLLTTITLYYVGGRTPRASPRRATAHQTPVPVSTRSELEQGESKAAPLREQELSNEAEYAALYGAMSVQLQSVYDALIEQIQGSAEAAFQNEFEAGRHQMVGLGSEIRGSSAERTSLVFYRFVPVEGSEMNEILRVELAESEYPMTFPR